MNMGFLTVETVSVILFFISFYALITTDNIIKSIISIGVMEAAVILFLLGVGFTESVKPPIGTDLINAADPLPQALVITAIIIGISVTAVNMIMFISLYRKHRNRYWSLNEETEMR